MRYWLMKSEPNCFSIDDLQRLHMAPWDGVRNYQARNMLRDDLHTGDHVLFYHSSCIPPGIVGLAKVVRPGYPDHTAFDPTAQHFDPQSAPENPTWYMVDLEFVYKFPKILSLSQLRAHPDLQTLLILRRGNRLSITPVTPQEWQLIMHIMGTTQYA